MRLSDIVVVWVAILMQGMNAQCAGQEMSEVHMAIRAAQQRAVRIHMLLRVHEVTEELPETVAIDIAQVTDQLKRNTEQLITVEDLLLREFEAKFAGLPVDTTAVWHAGPRKQRLFENLPPDIRIHRDGDKMSIIKTGNPPDQPVAPSPTYHVCPSVIPDTGERVAIRFTIPTKPTRGGTPIPYFGLRDAAGQEHVLLDIARFCGDGKSHEILVQVNNSEYVAVVENQMEAARLEHQLAGMKPPVSLAFFMNDTAELLVQSIRYSSAVAEVPAP